tara:strand:- start:91 stop:540 length:450 start_codon:yes stop_codon:yes gene_type:complete
LEKDNNHYFIHKDLSPMFSKKEHCFFYSMIEKTLIDEVLSLKKTKKIIIIDKTFYIKNKKIKKFYVNNHVNKTGENPLRGRQKIAEQPFFDITGLYKKREQGITTVGLGKKYLKEKNKHKYPSTYLLNISILCKAVGFKKVEGLLINTF